MDKIIIYTTRDSETTRKIVSLFNGGDSIHVDLVLTASLVPELEEFVKEHGTEILVLNEDTWNQFKDDIIGKVTEISPRLVVIDGIEGNLPPDLSALTNHHVICVTSAEEAPQQVVTAIESIEMDSNQKIEKSDIEGNMETEDAKTLTPDEEWAEALQINFTPPKLPGITPPPLPSQSLENENKEAAVEIPVDEIKRVDEINPAGYDNVTKSQREYEKRDFDPSKMPPTYLIWSVIITICCCFIPGIIAIIFSSQVSTRFYAGDIEGAWKASRNAEIWIIVSFVLGVISSTVIWPLWVL